MQKFLIVKNFLCKYTHRRLKSGVIFVLMLVSVMNSQAISVRQNILVSLDYSNAKLITVLNDIEKQTAYRFFYNHKDVNDSKKVDAKFNAERLNVVVNEILGDQYNIEYNNNVIMVTKKEINNDDKKERIVKGVVLDEKQNPMPGVTVIIQGTSLGTATNADGKFSLLAPDVKKCTLCISFVGMKKKFVEFTGQKFIKVILEEDKKALEEVVVNGYFAQKKNSFSGSVKTFDKEQLKNVSAGNIINTLGNLDASFNIAKNNELGSDPNQKLDISIRGKGSFMSGSSNPIFIVDGFEMTIDQVFDMDENIIEKVSILKDASATILYGSKAANGVVLIETKQPKAGKLFVDYNFRPTVSIVDLTDYDLLNSREKLEWERKSNLYLGGIDGATYRNEAEYDRRLHEVLRGVDTYWLSQPVEDAISQQHSINISGGDSSVKYGVNLNYNKKNGVMKESGRDVFSLRTTLSYRMNDKFLFKNALSVSRTKAYNSPYGTFSDYARCNPWAAPYDNDGNILREFPNNGGGFGNGKDLINPLYAARQKHIDDAYTNVFRDDFNLEWFINDSFKFKGSLSYTKTIGSKERYVSSEISNAEDMEDRGKYTKGDNESQQITGNAILSYNKTINDHRIFLVAGAEFSQKDNVSESYSLFGFADDQFSDPSFAMRYSRNKPNGYSESTVKSVGFLAKINWIYNDWVFADFSSRIDGSSNFGADKKYAPFWSLGAGLNLHSLKSWNKDFCNFLKIRCSHGVVGNQEFSAYQARTMYNLRTDVFYGDQLSATLKGFGNKNLKWQIENKSTFGIETRFLNNRFYLEVEAYRRNTDGTLADITVAPQLGFEAYTANLGEIENKGWQINAKANIIDNKKSGLLWSVGLQATQNKDKIIRINNALKKTNEENDIEETSINPLYKEGHSMLDIYAVRSLGINPQNGKEMFLTKDNKVTYIWNVKDKVSCGNKEPKVRGILSNNFYYKGFNLSMSFRYTLGGDIYNQTLAKIVEGADPKYNADKRVLNNRWQKPGDVTFFKDITDTSVSKLTSRFVQRENTLELSSITLSYDIPKKTCKKFGVRRSRLTFRTNDLLRLSTVKQERGTTYPFARSFSLGLNISI